MDKILQILQFLGGFNDDPTVVLVTAGGISFTSALLSFWIEKKGFYGCLDGLFGILIVFTWFLETASVVALVLTMPDGWKAIIVWFGANIIGGITGYVVSELLPGGKVR